MLPAAMNDLAASRPVAGLAALEGEVARDLERLTLPPASWPARVPGPDGREMLDVLVIGAGMCGIAAAATLIFKGVAQHRGRRPQRRRPGGSLGHLRADDHAALAQASAGPGADRALAHLPRLVRGAARRRGLGGPLQDPQRRLAGLPHLAEAGAAAAGAQRHRGPAHQAGGRGPRGDPARRRGDARAACAAGRGGDGAARRRRPPRARSRRSRALAGPCRPQRRAYRLRRASPAGTWRCWVPAPPAGTTPRPRSSTGRRGSTCTHGGKSCRRSTRAGAPPTRASSRAGASWPPAEKWRLLVYLHDRPAPPPHESVHRALRHPGFTSASRPAGAQRRSARRARASP